MDNSSESDKKPTAILSPWQPKDLQAPMEEAPADHALRPIEHATLDHLLQEANAGAILVISLSNPILSEDIDATKLQFGFCSANVGPGMIPVLLRFLLLALKGGLQDVFKKL